NWFQLVGRGVDLQHGQVAVRGDADQPGGPPGAIVHDNANLRRIPDAHDAVRGDLQRVAHDVEIRNDSALVVPNKAGPGSLSLRRARIPGSLNTQSVNVYDGRADLLEDADALLLDRVAVAARRDLALLGVRVVHWVMVTAEPQVANPEAGNEYQSDDN